MRAKIYVFEVVSENGEHYLTKAPMNHLSDVKDIGTFYTRTTAIEARDKERLKQKQRIIRNAKSKESRKAKNDVMSSLGLTKVKGALGGTYWE
jgi:hypothetical protein